MKDRLTIKLDEDLKCDMKESAELVDLKLSEFLRVLYICYKFSNEDDDNSLKNKMDKVLWSYRAKTEKELNKTI